MDPEGNALVFTDISSPRPSFVSLTGNTYSFTPPYTLANGVFYTISFRVSDGVNTEEWDFTLLITNTAPSLPSLPVD